MENKLTLLEEFDATSKMRTPHLLFSSKLPHANKSVAFIVLAKKEDEILLINSPGFKDATVLAGLSEKHIEYIAKNAPRDYRENLVEILYNQTMFDDALEIAKSMDEDLGEGITQNQNRIKKVIQYIQDNRTVFQF